LPDVLARWEERNCAEHQRARTAQSFCVRKADIAASGNYDLSLNRYKEVEHEEREHPSATIILRELRKLEAEISEGLRELEEMMR
jgi:type I restriction enzyme M protein